MEILNKLKNREIDQVIIRIGKKCNFKCLFCNVGENEKRIKDIFSYSELIKEFLYQISKSKIKNNEILVSISGGEPTLFKKELIFISNFIYKFGLKKNIKIYLELQTNCSYIDNNILSILKKYGLVHILVSFHTHDKFIFEELIGVDYYKNFPKICNGINLILKNNIDMSFNIIFNKINYKKIRDTLLFLLKSYPKVKNYNIGYFQPNGYGEKNYKKLFIEINIVLKYYLEAIFILENNKKDILSHFTGLPICLLGKYKKYSLEYLNNINNLSSKSYLINKNNFNNKNFKKECLSCRYIQYCDGIWHNFFDDIEVKPILKI